MRLTTFQNSSLRTPKLRKTVNIPTPRTPTPFKNALAAQEKMHGPLKMEVSSKVFAQCCPATTRAYLKRVLPPLQPQPLAFLEEDIREVLKQETGADIFNRADVQTDYRTWKHVRVRPALQPGQEQPRQDRETLLFSSLKAEGPFRKVRKSLVLDLWGKDCMSDQELFEEQLNNAQVSRN